MDNNDKELIIKALEFYALSADEFLTTDKFAELGKQIRRIRGELRCEKTKKDAN